MFKQSDGRGMPDKLTGRTKPSKSYTLELEKTRKDPRGRSQGGGRGHGGGLTGQHLGKSSLF